MPWNLALFLPAPHLLLTPARMSRSQITLGIVLMFHTHLFLPHSPSALSFPCPFLLSCPWHFDNLCTCSSTAGVCRCCHYYSLYIGSTPVGVRRGHATVVFAPAPPLLVLREAVTAEVFAPAPLPLVLAEAAAALGLCTDSALVGARRDHCSRSLYIGS